MKCMDDYLVTKKSLLVNKQKMHSRRVEEAHVSFMDANYLSFKVEGLPYHLPGHMKGIFRLHSTNFVCLTKWEMCHNLMNGGKAIKVIVKRVFEVDSVVLREKQKIRQSGRESLYYITGWLISVVMNAAKRRDKLVKEQLFILVRKCHTQERR